MPRFTWDEKKEKYVILFLPLVGCVLGLLSVGWMLFCRHFGIGAWPMILLLAAGYILYTGGIHLDGLMDTADARNAYVGQEERQRILADPHVGAFGVIRLCLFMLLILGSIGVANGVIPFFLQIRLAFLIPILGRMTATFALAWCPAARKEGLFYRFSGERHGTALKVGVTVEAVLIAIVTIVELQLYSAVLFAYITIYLMAKRMAIKDFGGMSGDLAGWMLCLSELFAVIVASVVGLLHL